MQSFRVRKYSVEADPAAHIQEIQQRSGDGFVGPGELAADQSITTIRSNMGFATELPLRLFTIVFAFFHEKDKIYP
jgi:hypothetical protein